eukprot:TRINITY_DN14622_c0_g1_i2.p1 TRINITY_DN14622_c0_g1~~TRINITY_DN14622_c0_g1_i2.p1  ORF type:complete len:352 (-),score=59.74 TRINITY_DN14622_c0_g1_i2:64-1119(-)
MMKSFASLPCLFSFAALTQAARLGDETQQQRQHFDLVVIGGGPAGLQAATHAGYNLTAEVSVALIEPKDVFGVPTGAYSKMMRGAALKLRGRDMAGENRNAVWEEAKNIMNVELGLVVSMITQRIAESKVTVLKGTGELMEPSEDGTNQIRFEEAAGGGASTVFSAEAVVLATGSLSAKRLRDSSAYELKGMYDSDNINFMGWPGTSRYHTRTLPESILISGNGIIAVEYADFLSRLGVQVTINHRGSGPVVLKEADEMAQEPIQLELQKRGVRFTICKSLAVTGPEGPVQASDDYPGLVAKCQDTGGIWELPVAAFLEATGRYQNSANAAADGVTFPKGSDPRSQCIGGC